MECWVKEVSKVKSDPKCPKLKITLINFKPFLNPLLHYSNTPIFHYFFIPSFLFICFSKIRVLHHLAPVISEIQDFSIPFHIVREDRNLSFAFG